MKSSRYQHLKEAISHIMAGILGVDDPDRDLAVIDLSNEYGIVIFANTKDSRIPWHEIGKNLNLD